jgi:hypothetical protein
VSDLFEQPENATPLMPEEMRQLIPAYIAYCSELNAAEQENIARAQDWALGRKRDPLAEKFVRELHRRMLGDVWKWAGKFRQSERNLVIPSKKSRLRLARDRFTWGAKNLRDAGATRQNYILALKTADQFNLAALLVFARS